MGHPEKREKPQSAAKPAALCAPKATADFSLDAGRIGSE